jgi:hypothetical protein
MQSYYLLENNSVTEVLSTGRVGARLGKQGTIAQLIVRRRGQEIAVDRDELIIVKSASEIPSGCAKIILSTDNELWGFHFFIQMSEIAHLTLEEQSEYVSKKARREIVRVMYSLGVQGLADLNTKLKTLHLHDLVQEGKINYACDHKHEGKRNHNGMEKEEEQEQDHEVIQLLSSLISFPKENPRESLARLREVISAMPSKDKISALNIFLKREPSEKVKERIAVAEITEGGRDEYLQKYAILEYFRYVRSLNPALAQKQLSPLTELWVFDQEYRQVKFALNSQ